MQNDGMFCTFMGMTSLMLNSKLCNFTTSAELVKTGQNAVQGSFSIKSLKLCPKNRVEFFVPGSL